MPGQTSAEEPVFVLTSDQDWAAEAAMRKFLEKTESLALPVHIFRTNPCSSLQETSRLVTYGWHPNFLPGSSHGDNAEDVLSYFKRHFPGLRTVRTHAFVEDTPKWLALREAGILVDSQTVTRYQRNLYPIRHWTGIVRFPIFFEDDVFCRHSPYQLDLNLVLPTLFSPGLKILNFHATFVANNIPSRDYYEEHKKALFSSSPLLRFDGRGTEDVFDELIATIKMKGYAFQSFEDLFNPELATP